MPRRISFVRSDEKSTGPHAITQKSTSVTKTAVSQKLKQSFKNELGHLGFRHVEVELREAGGADGVLYHKLVLTRAPGVELPKVVSEEIAKKAAEKRWQKGS